ncbi:UPF0182 family membrane protein [Scrofimicrobium canadense]|uniref:UPF0182 family membrane protein n=1 Tax=Scrofimicrobium canadense TaxID=2652290 RepID=UPI00197D6BD5
MSSFFPPGFFGSGPAAEGDDGDGSQRQRVQVANPFKNPLVITVAIVVLIGLFIYFMSHFWTEVLWYRQVGAERVLWTGWIAAGVLGLIGFIVVFAVLATVIHIAYRKRPAVVPGAAGSSLRAYQQALEPVRKLVFWGGPIVIGTLMAFGLAANWRQFLLWINSTPFGEVDPQYGLDISFYVFSLPVMQTLVSFLISVAVWSLIAVVVVNYIYGGIQFAPKFRSTPAARMQVGIIAAVLSLLIGVRYWMSIYTMLYQNGTLVDGALYSDINATRPAYIILAVISVLVAALFVFAAFKGTWRLPVTGVVVTVVAGLVIGVVYPSLVQQFRVTPNARVTEQPYIQRNIDATLKAYGLDDVEFQTYTAKTDASPGQLREDSDSTSQIRLLDPAIVSPTFRQLQQSRPYYTFPQQLAVDRYEVDGEKRDTVISVRDLNLDGLNEQQRNWVNQHTVYTHGYGVVAAYGNTANGDGAPSFWEQSIPSEGDLGEYEPRVYFSANAPAYSIVGAPEGAAPQELDYPDDTAPSGQVQTTFSGDGGPSVGNMWNKLLYAVKFGSTDIFFSDQTNSESQILYHRDPLERVSRVAPFLTLEQRAYPAVVDMDGDESTPKRLVWVVDAYTTANTYPYAEHMSLNESTTDSRTLEDQYFEVDTVNYMRNSVKAVVDAYDGTVSLFAWDAEDPVLQAWSGVYPGMVKDISEVSGDLMSHFRYPEDMFKVQRSLLQTYHITEASEFYTGGDRWRLSEDPASSDENGTGQKLQAPYYLTMQMPTQETAEFSLTSVYVPAGTGESRREAMAGFLAVDSETGNEPGKIRDGYGKLRLMALPSSTTVPGPGQVQNSFNSDQEIATKLNLLGQQGSKVIRGNLLTLPVGGGLLYVQPIYVQSTSATSYPLLRYVLTAFGDQIGFASTLEASLDQTFGGDAQATVTKPDGAGATDTEEPSESLTPEEELNLVLGDARDALKESQDAMTANDWAAYGKAQEKLQKALEEAVLLRGLDAPATGEGPGTPGPEGPDGQNEQLGDLGELAGQSSS